MPYLVAATRKFLLATCLVVCAASGQTLTFSPSAVSFPGQKVGTTSGEGAYLNVVNSSMQAISISSVTLTGANAGDFAIAFDSCGSSIAAGTSCYLNLTFTPTALGARTASLNFSENAATALQTVALTGTGDGPIITLQVSGDASFYPQNVGTTSFAQTIQLINTGNTAVTLNSFVISGPNASDFFISSNDCGTSLPQANPFSSCEVTVNFLPTAAGVRSATLSITDNATGSPQTITLTGTGQAPTSALSVSPNNLSFGTATIGSTNSSLFNVTNTGTTPINFSPVVIGGPNAGDFAVSSNTCSSPLALSYSCSVTVTFTPTAAGVRSATVTIHDNASSSPQIIPLSGTGQAAVIGLTINPNPVTFSAVSVTSSAAEPVSLTNSGNAPITITGAAISGPNAGDFTLEGSCVGTYPSAGSYLPTGCSLEVVFAPTALGLRSAILTITDSGPGSPQTVPLTGSGQAASTLTFNPGSINFATVKVNATATQMLTITNNGTQPTTVPSFQLAGINASDFAITSNGCTVNNSNLNAGSSCALTISFTPASPGARSANLTTFLGAPPVIFLGGNGASVSRTLAFNTLNYSFGNQTVGTTSTATSLNVSNTGNMEIVFTSIGITGPDAGDFAVTQNGCGPDYFIAGPPSFLAANMTCEIYVSFTPSASGLRRAALTFSGNQAGSPQSLPLMGNGISPNAAVSTSPLALLFGSQPVGLSSRGQGVTFQNTGTTVLNLSSMAITGPNAGDFAFSDGFYCPDSNATYGWTPGQNCQVNVIFTPSLPGVRTAVLSISDNAGSSPQSVPLTGTGIGLPKTLSATSVGFFFGGQAVATTSIEQLSSLLDNGSANVNVKSISISGPNASDFVISDNECALFADVIQQSEGCSIGVSFTPSALGVRTASVTVISDATNSPFIMQVNGVGLGSSINPLNVFPTTLSFAAPVGTYAGYQIVTLANTGMQPISLSTGLTGSADFSSGGLSCTDNSFGTIINPGVICTIYLFYKPSIVGASSATLAISTTAGTQAISLKGAGQNPAKIIGAPASITFNAQGTGLTSLAQAIQIQNSGTLPVDLMDFAIGGQNAGDFSINANSCPASLQVSMACTVGVTFTPSATGARTAALVITDDAGGSPQSVALKGTGEASQNKLALSTTALTFGPNNVGTAALAPVVLTNSGNASVHLSGYSFSGANAGDFSITQNTCATTDASVLPVGGTCTITVLFKPAATGLRTAALQISDDASGGPQTVEMEGSGQTVARAVVLSPSTLTFGGANLGGKGIQTLSVLNTGDAAVTFSTYAIGGANAGEFVLTGNTCTGNALAAQASCLLTITFTPAASGARSATITITDNATGNSQSASLVGVGQTSAQSVSVLQPAYDFGVADVGAAAQSSPLSILNAGTSSVTFGSYAISGANASDFTTTANTCSSADGNVLPAGNGSQCSLTVTFKPSQSGVRTATLVITDSAPGSPHSIALTGVGQAATKTLLFSPASYYDFGAMNVGASASANFSVTNTGTENVIFSKISILGTNASEFVVASNSCITQYSTVLSPNEYCSVSLTFTPGAAGIRTASLIMFYNGSTSPQTISLKGEGQALKSSLQVSTTNLLFTAPLGASATTKNLYLTNTGVGGVFFGNASVSGPNAADFSAGYNSCQNGYDPTLGFPPGSTCPIAVSFTPSTLGTETATLNVPQSDSTQPLTITLTGLVQSLQKALAVDADYHIVNGSVGFTSQIPVYLTSVSTGPVTLSAISILGAAEFTVNTAGSSCAIGVAIPTGSECTIFINFSPTAVGLYSAALQITDNASNSMQKVVLEGAATLAQASLAVYGTGASGGLVPVNTTSAQFYELIQNPTSATLTLGSPTIVGANAGDFSIVSSTCGTSLMQYGSCFIYLTMTPSAIGPRTAAVELPYSGGTGTLAYGVIGGDGSGGSGFLALSPNALEFDQTNINSTNISQFFQVTNTGTGPINFSPFTFSGANASDFNFYQDTADYRSCANVLPPGGTCRLSVQFTPSGSGLRSAVMQVNGDASNMPQNVSLIGEGQAASELLFTSTPSVDFGSQNIDSGSSTATVSLASDGTAPNIGLANLQITGVNAAEFTISSTSCGNVLSTTCQVQIMFAPAGLGVRNANLVVTSDAPGSPLTIPLYGVGQPVTTALAINATSIDFGLENVNAQNLQTINLINQGNSTVNFILPAISGANPSDFVVAANNCAILTVSNNCSISVAFTPSAVGERTAALQINDSAAGSPQTVALFGTGQIVSHLLSASAATLDFGGQSIGVPSNMVPVQISNTGTSPVALTGIALTGNNAADFIIDVLGQGNCAGVLPAGATCTINLQFDPSVTGPETATLKLSSNSAAGSILVSLLGEGQKAVGQLSASTLTLDLGGQTAGTTSATGTVNVTNTGDTLITFFPASITGANAGSFALGQGTCSNTLAPGSACSFGVTFSPTSSGVATAVLQINSTASASPLTVSLTGTGK